MMTESFTLSLFVYPYFLCNIFSLCTVCFVQKMWARGCCCCCCLFIKLTQPPSLECIQTMKGTAKVIYVRVEANQTRESTCIVSRSYSTSCPSENTGLTDLNTPKNVPKISQTSPQCSHRDMILKKKLPVEEHFCSKKTSSTNLTLEKIGDWKKLEILVQNKSLW